MKEELEQHTTPLLDAMCAYVEGGAVAFHTPGHKQGKGMHRMFKALVTDTGLAAEVSLMEELDDLHAPGTCIKAAQDLAARLYGAEESYFFVNGTTGAIHAMLLAALNPGEKVIAPRNAHRSVIGGIMLSGAVPAFVQPEIDPRLGIAMAVSPADLAAVMDHHADAKAVLLVHPTYYGVAADLGEIAALVHERGMVLLVDEAHGPHLKFCEALPAQALDAGADLVAQSTHKILGAMTQASMLHAKYDRIDRDRLRRMVSLVQTTSPNYLLMASLDVARMQMATEGRALIAKAVALAAWARAEICRIEGLYCFGEERLHSPGAYALDVTKLTVTVRGIGLSGAEAERILRAHYNIQAELSDLYNVLFIISIGDGEAEVRLLLNALRALAELHRRDFTPIQAERIVYPRIPRMAVLPRDALFAERRTVAFAQSAGLISAELITFYPPGIPVLCPGEIIDADMISHCLTMQRASRKVVGPDDCRLINIKVVK